jgi:hypothetical protein
MIDLEAIEARAKAATPGPWFPRAANMPFEIVSEVANICHIHDGGQTYDSCMANAAFIVHAREDLPALVNEARAAREVVGHARSLVELLDIDDDLDTDLKQALDAYDRAVSEP